MSSHIQKKLQNIPEVPNDQMRTQNYQSFQLYPLPDAEEERDVRGHEDEDERDGDPGVVAALQL